MIFRYEIILKKCSRFQTVMVFTLSCETPPSRQYDPQRGSCRAGRVSIENWRKGRAPRISLDGGGKEARSPAGHAQLAHAPYRSDGRP